MRALLALAFSITLSAAASAQGFPSRPIKLVIPFPPAGITDLSGRLVAEGLRAKFNQPVIVENKPGAQGVIGLREMLKADADGYTLMVGTVGSVVIGYAIDANPQFDPMRDLVPIAGTAEYATAMVVNNKTPVRSVQEFIDYAKARPGKLTFGSTGVGAMDYLAVELFMRQTGTSMVHVPYRGGPAALHDLMGGNIDLLIEVFPVVMEQIRSGQIRGLAVSSPYRLPAVRGPADLQGGRRAGRRAHRLARRLRAAAPAGGRPRHPRQRHRRGRQAARGAGQVPRHRLRAHRARREGVLRVPRRRGQALGRVPCGDRAEESRCPMPSWSRCAASARPSPTASLRSTGSTSMCGRASSCRCSVRPAAASRPRCG